MVGWGVGDWRGATAAPWGAVALVTFLLSPACRTLDETIGQGASGGEEGGVAGLFLLLFWFYLGFVSVGRRRGAGGVGTRGAGVAAGTWGCVAVRVSGVWALW